MKTKQAPGKANLTSKHQMDKALDGRIGKVRYAVVGLGYIAQVAVLPGFKTASENSQLVALVSDDAVKLKKLGAQYKVKHHTLEAPGLRVFFLRSGGYEIPSCSPAELA